MAKHKTFFGKIFGSGWDFLRKVFKAADHELLEVAIKVVNSVKVALNSPIVDILTEYIPGGLDNKLVEIFRGKLPFIVADALLIKSLHEGSTEQEVQTVMIKIADDFKIFTKEEREQFYTSLGAKIFIFLNEHKHGEKITFGQGAALVEGAFQAWTKLKEDA